LLLLLLLLLPHLSLLPLCWPSSLSFCWLRRRCCCPRTPPQLWRAAARCRCRSRTLLLCRA
jgi:hypothetical protein